MDRDCFLISSMGQESRIGQESFVIVTRMIQVLQDVVEAFRTPLDHFSRVPAPVRLLGSSALVFVRRPIAVVMAIYDN